MVKPAKMHITIFLLDVSPQEKLKLGIYHRKIDGVHWS
jgi:hypothetical protein